MTVALVVAAAVGSGLVAGVFAAFSGFVMRAFAGLPAAAGATAMRAVDVTAVRPPLMTLLFGTAVLDVAAAAVLAGGPAAPGCSPGPVRRCTWPASSG